LLPGAFCYSVIKRPNAHFMLAAGNDLTPQ